MHAAQAIAHTAWAMAHAAHAIALYVQLRLYSSSRADQAIELARATQEREKERGNMSDTRRGREKREATRGRKRRERPGERKRGSKREGGGVRCTTRQPGVHELCLSFAACTYELWPELCELLIA